MSIVRWLAPSRPGELKLAKSVTLPGATAPAISARAASELAFGLHAYLDAHPLVKRIVWGPRIIHHSEQVGSVRILTVTAAAIFEPIDGALEQLRAEIEALN